MSFKYKDIIKKFGKIALCSATILGSFGAVLTANAVSNKSTLVSAASKNGNVITLNAGDYDEDEGNANSESYDSNFPIGEYTIKIWYNSSVVSNPSEICINVNTGYGWALSGNNRPISVDGNVATYTQKSDKPFTRIWVTAFGPEFPNAHAFTKVEITLPETDTKAPALETQVFMTNVDSPMTAEYILSQTKFVDEVDGDLTPVIVTDNYSSNKNKLGKWTIEVKATDKAGNTGTGTIEVWVLDKTAPTINGTSVFTSNMSSPLTLENILSHITVSDNVDSNLTPTVVSNGFTDHEQEKGEKIITLKATDNSGNESVIFTVKVNVVDDIKPTITGTSSYTTSYKNSIDLSTIESALTKTDNVDSSLTLEKIADNYTGNQSVPGTYTISYRTTDSSGNISETFNVTIEVNDKIPPVFYTNGKFIGITQANKLTQQDLVNLLIYMEGLYADETAEVNMLSFGGYEVGGVNAPGVYTLSYKVRTIEGESDVKTATIKVLGEEVDNKKDEEVKKENKVGKWFKEKIGDPLAKAWKYCKEHKWTWFATGGVVIGLVALIVFISNAKERRREERIANRIRRYRGRR